MSLAKLLTAKPSTIEAERTEDRFTLPDLPAALPPPRHPRAFLILLVLTLGIFGWLALAKITEVGKGNGFLSFDEGVTVAAFELPGRILDVLVAVGDTVSAGQPLARMDTTAIEQERERVRIDHEHAQQRRIHLGYKRTELESIGLFKAERMAAEVRQEEALLEGARKELELSEQAFAEEQAKIRQRIADERVALQFAKDRLSIQQEREDTARSAKANVERLAAKRAASKKEVEDHADLVNEKRLNRLESQSFLEQTENRLNASSKELLAHEARETINIENKRLKVDRREQALKAARSERDAQRMLREREITELKEQGEALEATARKLENELETLATKINGGTLRSPFPGVVLELAHENPGAVVSAGETVAKIAHQGSKLLLRGSIATQESGAVAPGMDVVMKFDAFPFNVYGVVHGTVTRISPTSRAIPGSSDRGLFYELDIALDADCEGATGLCEQLGPGQTATIEIQLRHRRLLSVLFTPVEKFVKDGGRLKL